VARDRRIHRHDRERLELRLGHQGRIEGIRVASGRENWAFASWMLTIGIARILAL
jgi:hypothetical protein